jgi:hypothetical protein
MTTNAVGSLISLHIDVNCKRMSTAKFQCHNETIYNMNGKYMNTFTVGPTALTSPVESNGI